MSKPRYDEVTRFIELRREPWATRLGIGHYDIEHVYLDSFYDGGDSGDDFKVTATTEGRWNYLQAKVKWYLPSMVRHTDEENEKILVHELCHVLLMPEQELLDYKLQSIASDDERNPTENEFDAIQSLYYERLEMATEQTAKAFWRAYGALYPITGD